MAAGLPVVASDIAGYRSVLTHNQEGLLVEPENEMAIAEAITALLEDPQMRSRMAAKGRRTAQRYDWKVIAPRILDYYRERLEASSAQKRKPGEKGLALNWRLQPSIKIPVVLNFNNHRVGGRSQ